MKLEFGKNITPKFYATDNRERITLENTVTDNTVTAVYGDVSATLFYRKENNGFFYDVQLKNNGKSDFCPEDFCLDLGIDTYMQSYPEWNEKYFPTFLRCEKTHIYGCFISPLGEMLAFSSNAPVPSYSLEYNKNYDSFGCRIHWASVSLVTSHPQPYHHPKVDKLCAGDELLLTFRFDEAPDTKSFYDCMANAGIPVLRAEKYTVEKGEKIAVKVYGAENAEITVTAPDGRKLSTLSADEYGLYTVSAIAENGRTATGHIYCRKPYEFYLKAARKEAVSKPQHATTHCESWYGFFSAYLAAKHYPDKELDGIADAMFEEIMPCMFDYENAVPTIIPGRIQNISSFISVLVDRYESDPKKHIESLKLASRFGDHLVSFQREDGAYYNDYNTHYTCVIYSAKSLLELYLAEKKAGYTESAKHHFESVRRAIDQLVLKLEDIGTEGEATLEDGMISCSALQIGFFALQLPENEREPYVKAVEHMIERHRCLENNFTPDCRSRGTTIRFWEAQYDVNKGTNMVSSPHGWSGWLGYALYYAYLLTGKLCYLTQLIDAVGACMQLISLDGNLRWAFCIDPYLYSAASLVPDTSKHVKDAYESVKLDTPAYEGKFVEEELGECYVDMISGWFRNRGTQKLTGGYYSCPLYYPDGALWVDRQGGCCDNDVHEVFKCMEETVLKKLFVHETENGELVTCSCKAENDGETINIIPSEQADTLVICLTADREVTVGGKTFSAEKGIHMYEI